MTCPPSLGCSVWDPQVLPESVGQDHQWAPPRRAHPLDCHAVTPEWAACGGGSLLGKERWRGWGIQGD